MTKDKLIKAYIELIDIHLGDKAFIKRVKGKSVLIKKTNLKEVRKLLKSLCIITHNISIIDIDTSKEKEIRKVLELLKKEFKK